MARTPRYDSPGQLHHVMNRASRRQVLFADRSDYRRFLCLLACSVRRGELTVSSYCLMSTHFHLVLSSGTQQLSYAMMRVQNAFSRYRNRRMRVDGPRMRGRFTSKPITSDCYLQTLIRYIDHNPTDAGLCKDPLEYPYGSARDLARGTAPPWLDDHHAMRLLSPTRVQRLGRLACYRELYGSPLPTPTQEFIARRIEHRGLLEDALDELMRAPPAYLARWMAHKVRVHHGRSPWTPVVGKSAVRAAIAEAKTEDQSWTVKPARKALAARDVLEAGLLATVCALTQREVARAQGCHPSTVTNRIQAHRRLMQDPDYRHRAGMCTRRAMDLTFPRAGTA